eukprot:SAG31_NODE_1258_length_9078_cov_12.076512_9_plen_36_part_01
MTKPKFSSGACVPTLELVKLCTHASHIVIGRFLILV